MDKNKEKDIEIKDIDYDNEYENAEKLEESTEYDKEKEAEKVRENFRILENLEKNTKNENESKNKKSLKKESEKLPPSKLDKALNIIILILILVIIGIVIFIATIVFSTRKNEIPQIEKHVKEYIEKDNYSYIVTIQKEDEKDDASKKIIKVKKVNNFIEKQITEGDKNYLLIKKENEDPIYYVEDGNIEKVEKDNEKYSEYSSEMNKDYLNIKKYSPTSLMGIKSKSNIIFSNGKTKLQFSKDTYLPEAFVSEGNKISFEFLDEEAKLTIPYIESEIKEMKENEENINE